MIKVEQSAKTIDEGIKNLMAGAKQDYYRMSTSGGTRELTGYSKEQYDNWDNKTRISEGKKYIKIVQDTGVFCFIAKEKYALIRNVSNWVNTCSVKLISF